MAAPEPGGATSGPAGGLQPGLAIVDRALALQPAAEAVIERCRGDDPATRSTVLGTQAHQVIEGYRRLREELRALRLPQQLAGELGSILNHHLELVGLAMELAYRPQTPEIERQRHRLNGLGPAADHLHALRDQLAAEMAAPGTEPG